MTKKQKIAFWSMYISFLTITTTSIFYKEQFIHNWNSVSFMILVGSISLCGVPIYMYVKLNPKSIDKWFKD